MKLYQLNNPSLAIRSRFPAGVAWVETDDITLANKAVTDACYEIDPEWVFSASPVPIPEGGDVTLDMQGGKVEL